MAYPPHLGGFSYPTPSPHGYVSAPYAPMYSPYFQQQHPSQRFYAAAPPEQLQPMMYKQQHEPQPYKSGGASSMLPIRVIGDVVLKDKTQRARFAGQGGAIRFFLLGKQIKHSFVEVDEASWHNEKHLFAQSHGLPSPELPILSHNGIGFYGSTAVLRYLTKKLGEYGSDVRKDFIADVVTDKLTVWRAALDEASDVLLRGLSEPALYGYISRRTSYFDDVENILSYYTTNSEIIGQDGSGSSFFTGNNPVMCDFYLFAILYDDKVLMETIESDHPPMAAEDACRLLDDRACLRHLYNKVAALPQITEYLSANAPSGNSTDPSSPNGATQGEVVISGDEALGYSSIPREGMAELHPCFDPSMMRQAASASYEPPMQQHQQAFCAAVPWVQPEVSYSYTPMPVAAAQYQQGFSSADPRMMAPPPMGASKMFAQQPQPRQHRLAPPQQQMAAGQMWGPFAGGGHPLRPLPHFPQQHGSQSYFPPAPSFPNKAFTTPAVKVRGGARESPKEGSTSSEAALYEGEENHFEMQ
eukprot:GHVS01080849.1.p1 GENE.GHVS01080849.1~~GHVS01080849.1.p1  ORF type:complete len:528 (+),score=111.03 GHVS01080849.1:268-1851(+)